MNVPVVALVGRPNVGKSSLFNRLTGEKEAIVSDIAGTTRDRNFARAEWNGRAFWLVDTGGLPEDDRGVNAAIRYQVEQAIEEADLLLLIVDGKLGLHPQDTRLVEMLRHSQKPWLLVVNKVDDPSITDYYEFYSLGAGDPNPVSAINGKQTGDLLDQVVWALPQGDEPETEALRIAVVGRPNVGKSSLVNALLGEERLVVSEVADHSRCDRHADGLSRPHVHVRGHRGIASPSARGRWRGVLLHPADPPGAGAVRCVRARDRRDRGPA